MANYKVAYGRKENISYAIDKGVIPPGCIILTEDSEEIFFYDLTRNLKTYERRNHFNSLAEAEAWISQYDCKGQIFSIHEGESCDAYIVQYTNKLSKINSLDYIVSNKNPTESDIDYQLLTNWINVDSENVFILVSIKENKAKWRSITSDSKLADIIKTSTSYISSVLEAGETTLSIKLPEKSNFVNAVVRDEEGEIVLTDLQVIENVVILSVSEALKFNLLVQVSYYDNIEEV